MRHRASGSLGLYLMFTCWCGAYLLWVWWVLARHVLSRSTLAEVQAAFRAYREDQENREVGR